MADPTGPLAKAIYDAHARSRRLKTRWSELNAEEKGHWTFVSTAVIAFLKDFMMEEE